LDILKGDDRLKHGGPLKKLAVVLSALAAVLAVSEAHTEGLEITPVIGGEPMRCRDFRGAVVRTTRATELGDVGRAQIITRMPIISLDPDRLRTLPPKMQIFFYMHECAHHVLGHTIHPTLESEKEADCWAIRYGREARLISRLDVDGFGPYLANSRGSRFGHLPGPERQAYLLQCFDDGSSTEAALNR
jgi:hypothetical protein